MAAALQLPTTHDLLTVDGIAAYYAQELASRTGHAPRVSDYHRLFAESILSRNAYGLSALANGLNNVGKAVFSQVTGVHLPRTQSGTWAAILEWAGVDPKRDELREAERRLQVIFDELSSRFSEVDRLAAFAADNYARGFVQVIKSGTRYLMADAKGSCGLDLSTRGMHGPQTRPYIVAYLAVQKLKVELGLQTEPVYVRDAPLQEKAALQPAAQRPRSDLSEQLGMGF
ncbi:hypothetical protein [Pseudomonas nitroreducens]|uniref:hypothetical protein n=1 Tax=Pseudomonas nitroreducens TaxID=46680 RepID=UPI00351D8326